MSEPASSSSHESNQQRVPARLTHEDWMSLTKFRLSVLVIVTTFFGFWMKSSGGMDWWLLFHTLVGSTLAAFGAAVFNQLMEIEPDRRMERTADRPLPSRRMEPSVAFGVGWLLSAVALIHLANMVNIEASILTAMTLAVYLFVYTPMKQGSPWNTIVGAVSGALPPLIGWVGAVGRPLAADAGIRWNLMVEVGAVYLFALLFLWQLPHFLAINWMYREEYMRGGFVMWANDDENGRKTSRLALGFSLMAGVLMFLPPLAGLTGYWFLAPALVVNGVMILLAWKFCVQPERPVARRLFLYTLIYLPLMLGVSVLFWR